MGQVCGKLSHTPMTYLYGDSSDFEEEFVYLTEQPNGSVKLQSAAKFRDLYSGAVPKNCRGVFSDLLTRQ